MLPILEGLTKYETKLNFWYKIKVFENLQKNINV